MYADYKLALTHWEYGVVKKFVVLYVIYKSVTGGLVDGSGLLNWYDSNEINDVQSVCWPQSKQKDNNGSIGIYEEHL